jgi:hypothetical protein
MKQTTRQEAFVIRQNILKWLRRPAVTIRAAEILSRDRELAKLKVKRVQ